MDGLANGSRSGAEGSRGALLHSGPVDDEITALHESGETPEAHRLSKFRTGTRGTRSRPGPLRADKRAFLGTPMGVRVAAVLGILLISVMTLRLLVCFGTLTLRQNFRQDVSSGSTSRRLAVGEESARTVPSSGGSDDADSLPRAACPGAFYNLAFDVSDEDGLAQPDASTDPGNAPSDGTGRSHIVAIQHTQAEWRELLGESVVQLGFLLLMVGSATFVAFAVEAPRKLHPATWVLSGLFFLVCVPFFIKVWQKRADFLGHAYQRTGPVPVRL